MYYHHKFMALDHNQTLKAVREKGLTYNPDLNRTDLNQTKVSNTALKTYCGTSEEQKILKPIYQQNLEAATDKVMII